MERKGDRWVLDGDGRSLRDAEGIEPLGSSKPFVRRIMLVAVRPMRIDTKGNRPTKEVSRRAC